MSKIAMIGQIHEDGWKILKQKNYDVFEITNFSKENLIKELKEVDAVALRTATLYEDVLIHCPKIKIISRHGVGYNNVDLDYLNKHKQALAVTGTSNAVSVAEHVMTMFLNLAKNIDKSNSVIKNTDANLHNNKTQKESNIKRLDEIEKNYDDKFENLSKRYSKEKENLVILNNDYKLKDQIIKTKQNQTTILNKHDWFETNDTCKKCSFLTGAFVAKKELQEDIIELNNVQSNIKEAHAWFELYPNFAEREKKFGEAKRNKHDMQNSIEKLAVVRESLGMRLELEDNKLGAFIKEKEVYIQNEDSIIHNDKVKEKITIVDEEIYKLEENTRKNNDEILKNNTFLGQITQRITDLGGNIEILKEIEKKYILHEFLMDAFSNQVGRINLNAQCQRGPDSFPFNGRKDSAEGTLSVSDALRVFSIRTLVATKASDSNKQIISTIIKNRDSAFLSTDYIV